MNKVARAIPICRRAGPQAERAGWRVLAPACVLFGAGCAASAQVPDAGRMLRESAPAPFKDAQQRPVAPSAPAAPLPAPAQNQPSFVLESVRFNGATVFSDATLHALVAHKLGQRATLADLQQLAAAVTAHYRNAGYILSQAVVPAQDVSAGKVEFTVLEGRLARVRIERIDEVPIPDRVIEGLTSSLPRGRPLTQRELERAVLMLSDLPGMAAQAALEAGDEAGTYDLVVELKSAPRYNLSVDVDNHGSRATGEYRIGALVRVNSPFGRGDNLDLRLLNSFGKGLAFGRASYELPVGYAGLRASAAYAHVQYELGKDFAALDAFGTADVAELAATYPLLRSRTRNLFAKAGIEVKRLNDHVDAVGQDALKHMQALSIGVVYEGRDGWIGGGYVSAGLTGYLGRLDIRSQPELLADQDAFGRHTNGRYRRASYSLSRLQSLGASLSAYLALAGQWAGNNLDSADKIAAGGPRAVRAFSGATGIGDEARIVNAELRWSVNPDTSLSAFYDIGRVRINHTPLAGEDNSLTLAGYGVGLYWGAPRGVVLRASVAWPRLHTGAAAGSGERTPRAYAQLVKVF